MRGFIRKRASTWTAYYYVVDGMGRHQRSRGGFRTKAEAAAWLNETVAALQAGTLVDTSRLTLGEYLRERWLPTAERRIRPTTFDAYKRLLDRHVIPALGAVPLRERRADHLDSLYSRLLRSGHVSGTRGLAPKSVRHVHIALHKALRDAERKGLVVRNVAAAADPPKGGYHTSYEITAWTAEELRTFLNAMADHPLYAAYMVAATTGMRRGEVLGLRWRDIDWTTRRLQVRQSLITVNYQLHFSLPKTKRSRRSIALDATTIAALQAHRAAQRQHETVIGMTYEHDLVFIRLDGRPVRPDCLSQVFDREVAKLPVRRIRLHDLRHTHATLGLAAGIAPKVISDRLGHATVAFTQDVYMHAIPQLEEDSADQIADLIFAPSATTAGGID